MFEDPIVLLIAAVLVGAAWAAILLPLRSWAERRRQSAEALGQLQRPAADIQMPIPGWHETAGRDDMRVWQHASGARLTLTFVRDRSGMPSPASITTLRVQCRGVAEEAHAGLIEADVVQYSGGVGGRMIYKRLSKPAFVFTGMIWAPHEDGWLVWTIVDGEHGMTGMREAQITAELFNSGALTIEKYESTWAQDPYYAQYDGVDRSTLRYMSDDAQYDERFPTHPLTHVRRVLNAIADRS